jgi:hypothetical protein
VVFRGAAGVGIYLGWSLLFTAAGFGLLKRMQWSCSLAIALQIFGFLSGTVTVMSPRYEALMREAMSSVRLPTGQSYPIPAIEHLRVFAYIGLVFPLIILWILVYYRPKFLEACETARHPT